MYADQGRLNVSQSAQIWRILALCEFSDAQIDDFAT